MFILKLCRYFLGSYRIRAKGWNLEKLLNIAISRGVHLWDIQRDRDDLLFTTYLYSYSQLQDISKRVNCSLIIEERSGLPFILDRLRKRTALTIGCALFVVTLYLLSSFVWSISVVGVETIPSVRIIESVQAEGLRVGTWKHRLDLRQIERDLMNRFDTIAWVGVEVKGTKITIKVVEKVVVSPENMSPCHLVACKDGWITEIIVLEGKQSVEKGHTVKKDDILISGFVQEVQSIVDENGEFQEVVVKEEVVKAKGIVKAKVWYEGYGEASLIRYDEERTGSQFHTVSLKIQDSLIPLHYRTTVPFVDYHKQETSRKLMSWRNFDLPVETIITTYYEINKIPEEVEVEVAIEEATNIALNEAREQIPQDAKVLGENVAEIPETDSNLIRVRALIEVEEEIGTLVLIE